MRAKEQIRKVCEYCGEVFHASRQDMRYCSHNCNRKAYRQKKRKEVAAFTDTLLNAKQKERSTLSLSDREYLSISEVALLLGWCKQSVYNYCHKGIIPAKRISKRTTLIRKKDIERIFDKIEPYEVLPTGERKPVKEWYTLDEVTEKYGILRHRIRKIVNAERIPTKKAGTRTLIAKAKTDAYFSKKGYDSSLMNLADWATVPEIMKEYGMSESAVHVFASRYTIPKKRTNGKLYYNRQIIDKLKNKEE